MSIKSVKRLFGDFQPNNYKLDIKLDLNDMTFSGTVVVSGHKSGRPSHRLTFHQHELSILSAEVTHHDKKGDTTVIIDRINNHNKLDEVRLHSKSMIYPGKYTVVLKFKAKISDKMHGLYPCNFIHNDESKMLIATQFESHHAREVFPCIDEPEAKATFDLTLTSRVGDTALSNTPVKSQSKSKNSLVTTFETTPIMSTYLLAFVTGDIHCESAKASDGTIVQTWGTIAQPLSSLKFANDEAIKILEYFVDYFQTPFPLSKIDQVALPDFESGAMENWGLITYREIALLTDAKNRSISSEQYVAMVVAHELSHQWFGNLVTMKWWDDLWLNESFASLMEHVALDAIHPDWHQWETFASTDVIACSNRDIYKDVQPVRVDVKHPDEIGTLFDPAIVYAKGGRLLKMLREYIGDESFRAGLKIYFDQHLYKNTSRDDLWSSLSTASGQDISSFMNPWLEQSGMPVITVTGSNTKAKAAQSRFVLDDDTDESLWPIATLSDGVSPKLFTGKTAELKDTKIPFILNQNGSGHYIVNYGSGTLKDQVDNAFAGRNLPSETRISYLNDLLLLSRRGDIPLTEILEVVGKSSEEPRDAVWAMMSRSVGLAHSIIEGDEPAHKLLRDFRFKIAKSHHTKLGWDDKSSDDINTKLLRLTILSLMLTSENTDTVDEALVRYKSAKSITNISSDHRGMILGTLVKFHPETYLDILIAEYKSTQNPEIQMAVTSGLSSIRDENLAKNLILDALGDKKHGFVRSQDIFRWFAYLMRNRFTRDYTWEWFVQNWDRLYAEFNESKSLDYFVSYAANPINTPEWHDKFREFFEPKSSIIALNRNIKIANAEITARVAWRKRDEAKIKKFLQD